MWKNEIYHAEKLRITQNHIADTSWGEQTLSWGKPENKFSKWMTGHVTEQFTCLLRFTFSSCVDTCLWYLLPPLNQEASEIQAMNALWRGKGFIQQGYAVTVIVYVTFLSSDVVIRAGTFSWFPVSHSIWHKAKQILHFYQIIVESNEYYVFTTET